MRKFGALDENGDAATSGRSFVMEAMTSFKKSVMYNMMDGQARCLIGRPIADDASAEITFMTEKMFPLKDFERAAFQVETRQVWDLLCDGRAVEAGAKAPSGCLGDGDPGEGESTSLDSNSLMWRHSPRQALRGRASLPILTLL